MNSRLFDVVKASVESMPTEMGQTLFPPPTAAQPEGDVGASPVHQTHLNTAESLVLRRDVQDVVKVHHFGGRG